MSQARDLWVRLQGWGFDPTRTSIVSSRPICELTNCASIPAALKAACRVDIAGVREISVAPSVPRTNIPTPINSISIRRVRLFSFLTVHPAFLNKGSRWRVRFEASSPPLAVYPKSITPPGNALRALTKSASCFVLRV